MVFYPVLLGYSEFLLSIFGNKVFNPLAKLTYGTYMFHILFLLHIEYGK